MSQSQNSLNKTNINLSKSLKKDNKNLTIRKENKNLYDILKPIVHDYSKLCKQHKHSSNNTKKIEKKIDSSVKLEFEEPKSKRIDNFIKTNVDKKFLCSICDNLFKDPLECYKCLNLFCSECMKNKLEEHKKCPTCFNIVFRDMMRGVDMEQMDSYKQARVRCPFIGCKENSRLKEIEKHIDTCIFQDMTEIKKKNLNKIIFQNDSDDPLRKTHMLNYLREVNKTLTKLNPNNAFKDNNSLTLEELGYVSKLGDLKYQISNLNDYAAKTMGDMTKITKLTNANLKNLINN